MAFDPIEIKGHHCLPHTSSVQNLPPATNLDMQRHEAHINFPQNQESSSSFFTKSFPSNSPIHFPIHMLSPNTSPLNEMSDSQTGISLERKLKRMKSNRESAQRSRMRKKKQIEELQYQVNHLQIMNHQLSEKVINLLESNHQIMQENSQLKEKVSSLQVFLSDLLTPMTTTIEESICNTNRLRGESSN